MMATYFDELLGQLMPALPRFLLIGAPFLLIGCGLAALLDAKLPWRRRRVTDGALGAPRER